jgi:hypothetical protein
MATAQALLYLAAILLLVLAALGIPARVSLALPRCGLCPARLLAAGDRGRLPLSSTTGRRTDRAYELVVSASHPR